MLVDKLGFNINDWVVDTIETIARMQAQIGELQRRISAFEEGGRSHGRAGPPNPAPGQAERASLGRSGKGAQEVRARLPSPLFQHTIESHHGGDK